MKTSQLRKFLNWSVPQRAFLLFSLTLAWLALPPMAQSRPHPTPMLTLATSRDPVVPGLHQISSRDAVAAADASDFLVQREIERYGHLTFTPEELGQAFNDLVLWVEFGVKPVP